MHDLKNAIKKHLKVTDLPKKLEEEEDDNLMIEDEEENFSPLIQEEEEDDNLTNMLKISVSKKGQKIIEKEANDVRSTWMKIKDSEPVRNVENSFKRWDQSKEVGELKALDRKFLASHEGKRLVAEWKDFGHALKKALHKDKDGSLHISNSKMDDISDEADDVAQ